MPRTDIGEISDHQSDFAPEQKRKAMLMFLDAWGEACAQGISGDLLQEVCLYLAVSDLVEERGEEEAAELMEFVPRRILAGQFTPREDNH